MSDIGLKKVEREGVGDDNGFYEADFNPKFKKGEPVLFKCQYFCGNDEISILEARCNLNGESVPYTLNVRSEDVIKDESSKVERIMELIQLAITEAVLDENADTEDTVKTLGNIMNLIDSLDD